MAAKKEPIPFNAEMLRWASEWRGRSVEEVAARVKQPVQKIQAYAFLQHRRLNIHSITFKN